MIRDHYNYKKETRIRGKENLKGEIIAPKGKSEKRERTKKKLDGNVHPYDWFQLKNYDFAICYPSLCVNWSCLSLILNLRFSEWPGPIYESLS